MDGMKLSPLILSCVLTVAFAAFGCSSPVKSSKAQAPGFTNKGGGTWVDPSNPADDEGPSEAAGFFIKIESDSATVVTHRSDTPYVNATDPLTPGRGNPGTGNFSTACKIPVGTTAAADKDFLCITEIEELDLYFSELRLQYHVPPSMCAYVRFRPYDFFAVEPGKGPTTVTIHFNTGGTIVSETNSSFGVPQCSYDYSLDGGGGPNCCTGTYDMAVTQDQPNDSGGNPVGPITTVTHHSWGGKTSSCLSGSAFSAANTYFDTKGHPVDRIEYVDGVGFNNTYTIDAAMNSKFNGNNLISNLWAANFYKPNQHYLDSPAVLPADRPVAMRVPANTDDTYMPSDTYSVSCLDRAQEVQFRIRLMIREWNTNPIAEGGNPDINVGTDPGFDGPINDEMDWLDIGGAYPSDLI